MDIYKFESETLVDAYRTVGKQIVDLVATIPPQDLDDPALGPWTTRVLVAHTMRSFSGVSGYLEAGSGLSPNLFGPSSYYVAAFEQVVSRADIDHRAVEEAKQLGSDLALACRAAYDTAMTVLSNATSDTPVKTPFGVLQLDHYLPSRIVELVVHGEDIKSAVGSACELDARATEIASITCMAVAQKRQMGTEALLALTGRRRLPATFDVLGFA